MGTVKFFVVVIVLLLLLLRVWPNIVDLYLLYLVWRLVSMTHGGQSHSVHKLWCAWIVTCVEDAVINRSR